MNNVTGIRLMYAKADGSEHVQDFATFLDAQRAVRIEMQDWVIFELVSPGKYATVGRNLAFQAA